MTLRDLNAPRLYPLNRVTANESGSYVLYWMQSARRLQWNYALDYAVAAAQQLGVGLIIFEPLQFDYPFANDRLHRFLLEGMNDNQKDASPSSATYYPLVEKQAATIDKVLDVLMEEACLLVTDFFPGQSQKKATGAVGTRASIPSVAIDSNGLLPLKLVEKEYSTAHSFRRFLHKALPAFIDDKPTSFPLHDAGLPKAGIPERVLSTWPAADLKKLLSEDGLAHLPIDHQVTPATQVGGSCAARIQLGTFLSDHFETYSTQRNVPDRDGTSRLSAYLRAGHISVHEIFSAITGRESWSSMRLALKPTGKRAGWWGMSETAEAFLDELVTWRELGYGFACHNPAFGTFDCLPLWAQETLKKHSHDERPYLYSFEKFQSAETHDPLWNAAQCQLMKEGRIHGYLRMLWGKKIIEWSPTPQQALETMRILNDRYALDGQNPNSDSGICWCFGLFDRAWGPERPIFGKVRYMTSKNTARKVSVKDYVKHYLT